MSESPVAGILLISVEPELGTQVQSLLANVDADIEAHLEPGRVLDRIEHPQSAVHAVVIGAGNEEPVRLAQRIHRLNRDIAVLILSSEEQHAQVSRAIHFTPFLGDHVTSHRDTDTEAIAETLREAVQRGRQRRRFRTTISAMNEQLQSLSTHRISATQYLDHVLDHAPIGVVALSSDGQIISSNRRAGEILEQRERALLGSSLFQQFPENERQRLKNCLSRAGQAERQAMPEVFARPASDGNTRFISATAAPISDEPESLGTLVILQDVTRQVINEREREAALQLRDEFLSVAAHELKTPLTSIKGFVDLLGRQIDRREWDHTRITRLQDQLRVQVDRLELLVTDLLDASRIQQGRLEPRMEPFDLTDLAGQVVQRFVDVPENAPRHALNLDVQGPVMGFWDRDRLDQVITNLVSNAIKYSPNGGEIDVVVRQDRDQAVLEISDQGVGIDPELQSRVFQPFMRADSRGDLPGTGLGLHITAQIVEQHKGTISVSSAPGQGSTFTVRLPLDFQKPGETDEEPPASRTA